MTPRRRSGVIAILAAHLRSQWATSAGVAVIIFVAVFAAAATPRLLAQVATDELHHSLASQPRIQNGLFGSGTFTPPTVDDSPTVDELLGGTDFAISNLPESFDEPLSRALGSPIWLLRTPGYSALALGQESNDLHVLSLAVDLDWQSRVKFIRGGPPAPWAADEQGSEAPQGRPPLDIALSADAADATGVRVGDLLAFPTGPLQLTGVYEPRHPSDPFWTLTPSLLSPERSGNGAQATVRAAAFIDPGSALGLTTTLSSSVLTAWIPLSGERLAYPDVDDVLEQLRAASSLGISLPTGDRFALTSAALRTIEEAAARVSAVTATLALTSSGPAGVLAVVVALAARSLLRRRGTALQLAAARGASGWSVRGITALEGLAVAAPASVLAVLLVVASVPAPGGIDLALPSAIGLAVPVLLASRSGAGARPRVKWGATGTVARSLGRVRDIGIVALAVLALVLLSRRGVVALSGPVAFDPLTAATPLLLAVAASLLILRIMPVAMRGLLLRLRRHRTAVGLIGASRAIREPVVGFSGSLAMVVGMSVTTFCVVMSSTVTSAVQDVALSAVGAPVRVEAQVLDDRELGRIEEVVGVARAAAVQVVPFSSLDVDGARRDVTLVLADTESLPAAWQVSVLVAPTEALGDDVPVVVSPALVEVIAAAAASIEGTRVVIKPGGDGIRLEWRTTSWVLADAAFAERLTGEAFQADVAIVDVAAGRDSAATAHAIEDVLTQDGDPAGSTVRVLDAATAAAEVRSAPAVRALELATGWGGIGALALCMLVTGVVLAQAELPRRRSLAILRTLGMKPVQTRALVLWEVAPTAAAAILTGIPLGLALAWLLTGVLDLQGHLAGAASSAPTVDPLLLAAVAVGFGIFVGISCLIAVAAAGRGNASRILRMGAE